MVAVFLWGVKRRHRGRGAGDGDGLAKEENEVGGKKKMKGAV